MEAQTKPPGRVSSNKTSAEGSALPMQTARIAPVHGTLAFAVPKDGMWTGAGGDHREAN